MIVNESYLDQQQQPHTIKAWWITVAEGGKCFLTNKEVVLSWLWCKNSRAIFP